MKQRFLDKKVLIAVGAVIVGAVVLGFLFRGGVSTTVIDSDRVIEGDYVIAENEAVVLKNGAKLSVKGNFSVDGEVRCENGPLSLDVAGAVHIAKRLVCERADGADDAAFGIAMVAQSGIAFDSDAVVVSNSSVQIVDDASKLISTAAELDSLFDDIGKDTGDGLRIGPLTASDTSALPGRALAVAPSFLWNGTPSNPVAFVNSVSAKTEPGSCVDAGGNVVPDCVRISGNWVMGHGQAPPPGVIVPTPPKGVNRIVLNINFGPDRQVQLQDFILTGPDGRKGSDDIGKSCTAIGGRGENAFRFNVSASDIKINNFELWLGNGGEGGTAETLKDCDPGKATGGEGGEAGNFKMRATGAFEIAGAFNIYPGVGGEGGDAIAKGKDGQDACPGKKGGDAVATGGEGGKNKKELNVQGGVAGTNNISVASVAGGDGGTATAQPGKGGNGTGCKCAGGPGGNGTTTGGKGGAASVKILGAGGTANGGNGGNADSRGGQGGNGGHCDPSAAGGNGGRGGDAQSKEGSGGIGTTANGGPGNVTSEQGGNGGNGGDGCREGQGGSGGSGNPPGANGSPGRNLCVVPGGDDAVTVPDTGSGTTTTPTPTPQPPPANTGTQIQVIRYQGKYLPVSQLLVESEAGCDGGQAHWHAIDGLVQATDGTFVPDPGPPCGYGKTSQNPATAITIPQ